MRAVLLLVMASVAESIDFKATWESLALKAQAGADSFQARAAQVDWDAMGARAMAAYDASARLAGEVAARAQQVNWTDVEMQAFAAAQYSREMAAAGIETGQQMQARMNFSLSVDFLTHSNAVTPDVGTLMRPTPPPHVCQAHFRKINWTEVGEGVSVAGSATNEALRASAAAAVASAEAAAHSANSLNHVVRAV